MLSAIFLFAAATMAPPAATEPQQSRPAAKDPNRKVCELVELSGSKFNKKRVCMTAAEWENARLADRQAVERIQMGACVRGGGC